MKELWNVSSSPHVRAYAGTQNLMFDVALALMPAAAFGVYRFGLYALCILATAVGFALLTEYTYEACAGKESTLWDGSALVTGLLLGMNLPPFVPLWIPMLGSIFAIFIVKQLFGGIGQNVVNPAMAARCFLLISFAEQMNCYFGMDGISEGNPSGNAEKRRNCRSGSYVYRLHHRIHRRNINTGSSCWRYLPFGKRGN